MKAGSFEPYKIFEFGKIELSQDDIAKIAPRHLRFMGQSCLAANDISVFLKIILGHFHNEGSDEILTQMSSLTRIILQRQLQAKIFEFIEMMDAYSKVCARKSDKVLGSVLNKIPVSIAEIKASPCYDLAQMIRNKITNHYAFRDWHEGAKRQSKGYKFNLYMHKLNGNSFFPFAEDASHLSFFEEPDFRNITYEQSFKWMANSNRELVRLQQTILIDMFQYYIPDFRLKQTISYVPDRLVFGNDTRYPIFSLLNGSGRW